jgi:hypothetical protein
MISVPIVILLLSIPAVLTYSTHAIARILDPSLPNYLTIIYAYLPFTLATNLARPELCVGSPSAIAEAGQILPVLARSLGYSGASLPTLTWSPDVAAFIQGAILLSSLVFTPDPTHSSGLRRITRRPSLRNIPHLLLLLGFTVLCFSASGLRTAETTSQSTLLLAPFICYESPAFIKIALCCHPSQLPLFRRIPRPGRGG